MKKHHTIAPLPLSAQDRYARQIASRLDAAAANLPHDLSERLRVARLQALEKHRTVQVHVAAPALMGDGTLAMDPQGERTLWPRLVSLFPLIALVAGLIAIQVWGTHQTAQDLADIDAAILTDDLPPDAYTDPGFAQFLKSRLEQLQQK